MPGLVVIDALERSDGTPSGTGDVVHREASSDEIS